MLNSSVRSIFHFNWGFSKISIDKESLANGLFILSECSGVTPDGLHFDVSENEPIDSRSLEGFFPATEEKSSVYLVVPVERRGGRNCVLEESEESPLIRYIPETLVLTDDNTGVDERQIKVARPNLQIRFESEPTEGYSTVKIAEILRSVEGGFILSNDYIPPSLTITASDNLMNVARRLLELLTAKSSKLWERRQPQPADHVEYSSSDMYVFWLLHTINAFVPVFNQHYTLGLTHPKELYFDMLALAGQLTTFSRDEVDYPRDFPIYDHNDLTSCFKPLEEIICRLLGEGVPTNVVPIPLEKRGETLFIGAVNDPSLLKEAQFFLVSSGDIPEIAVMKEIPQKVRIASPDTIEAVLKSYISALKINHSADPPRGLPSRPGRLFFQLEKTGEYWNDIYQSRAIAIFLPTDLSSLRLELVAIRRG
jgi:type VI secretion system protein ImpJ